MLSEYKRRKLSFLKPSRQKGAMLITATLWFIFLIGLTALAFDVGHLMIVRNELQNGADAAALAGANCLDKTTAGSGIDCTNIKSSTLNWSMASTKATNSIGLNKSDSTSLVNGTVQTGYWNVNGGTALQPISLSPLGPCTVVGGVMTTACDKPAVMVTLNRAGGSNGGPVGTLIGTMFGSAAIPISAKAVAVISSPGNVLPGSLVPMAINKCLYDLYWDTTSNSPKNATTSTLVTAEGVSIPQIIGEPWEFRIGSSYHYGACGSGQWTTFSLDSNSAAQVKSLINNGNPISLDIGDSTWIKPGTATSNYNDLDAKFPTPLSPPTANTSSTLDVLVPVIDVANLSDSTNAQYPIVAFAAFHIDDIQGGSQKYVQGHFIPNFIAPGSSGIGPSYGAYTPPRLAQ